MSKFTGGKWEHTEYVPEGITLNGREYVISSMDEEIALVRTEADARLIAAAPDMYELVKEMARPIGKNCYLLEQQAKKLLVRIGCEEAKHE